MFAPTSASIGWYHYMTDSLHSKYKPGITDHSVTMERSIPLNLDLTCMEVFPIIFNSSNISSAAVHLNTNFPLQYNLLFIYFSPNWNWPILAKGVLYRLLPGFIHSNQHLSSRGERGFPKLLSACYYLHHAYLYLAASGGLPTRG